MNNKLKNWARTIKQDTHALYLAARDHRTPWYARALALFIAGYALSPIDLIPDFIPVLGYLDDLIIIPLGIVLIMKMIPDEVMADAKIAAQNQPRPISRYAAMAIICLWIISLIGIAWFSRHYFMD